MEKKELFRALSDRFFKSMVITLSMMAVLPLFFVLGYILKKGFSFISIDFLFSLPVPVGDSGGGILNAIIGTIIITAMSSIISVPVGILAGVFVAENSKTRLGSLIRTCADLLHGIPSIIMGIIAYSWIVSNTGWSAFSGSVALSMMMIPVVLRATEESILSVPDSYREASLALGGSNYKTILKVIIPSSFSGILTGILLGLSRIAGETAPLLFTAFGSPYLVLNPTKPMSSLPHLIYNYAMSGYDDWIGKAWAASMVLIIIVFLLNIFTKWVEKKWKIQY